MCRELVWVLVGGWGVGVGGWVTDIREWVVGGGGVG